MKTTRTTKMKLLLIGLVLFGTSNLWAQTYSTYVPHSPFTVDRPDGDKWPQSDITYYFANGTADLPGDSEFAVVEAAFDQWECEIPRTFTRVYSESNADIIISWVNSGPYSDGPGGFLANARSLYRDSDKTMHESRIYFDDAETWDTSIRNSIAQPKDLITTALHEIGHALGLHNHSTDPSSMMYEGSSGSLRNFDAETLNRVSKIYSTSPLTFITSNNGTTLKSRTWQKLNASGWDSQSVEWKVLDYSVLTRLDSSSSIYVYPTSSSYGTTITIGMRRKNSSCNKWIYRDFTLN